MKKEQVVARLILVIEYDEIPTERDLQDVLEQARSLGEVVTADFETLKLIKRSIK